MLKSSAANSWQMFWLKNSAAHNRGLIMRFDTKVPITKKKNKVSKVRPFFGKSEKM
jgi:hypothetical protein